MTGHIAADCRDVIIIYIYIYIYRTQLQVKLNRRYTNATCVDPMNMLCWIAPRDRMVKESWSLLTVLYVMEWGIYLETALRTKMVIIDNNNILIY